MRKMILAFMGIFLLTNSLVAQIPPTTHPKTSSAGWVDLFKADLSNAIYPASIWSFTNGILTATEDQAIWSRDEYDNFIHLPRPQNLGEAERRTGHGNGYEALDFGQTKSRRLGDSGVVEQAGGGAACARPHRFSRQARGRADLVSEAAD